MDTEVQPGADASLEPEQIPTEADVEVVDELVAESEAESPPAEDQDLDENKDSFQERIDRLTRFRRDAEREADALRRQHEDLQKELEELRSASRQSPSGVEKTLADFDYNEAEYSAYLFKQASESAREAAREEAKRWAEEARQQERHQARQAEFDKKAAEFAKDQADFFELTQDRNLPITAEMAEVIMDSDIGPNIAYYLAKHPDEAYSIARTPPALQGRQIGIIESKLQAALKAKPKRATSAPPPPKGKVKGKEPGFATDPTSADSDKMSDAEWLVRREAQLAKRNG